MLPKHILVPVDFSATAEHALDYACELAAKLGATVHLVHAVPSPPSALHVAVSDDMLDNLVREHSDAMEKLLGERRGLATIGEGRVELGDPREVIIRAAERLGADLIVMGTHGRRGIRRVVMGSVAEDVIRHAPCPVLAVRGRPGET